MKYKIKMRVSEEELKRLISLLKYDSMCSVFNDEAKASESLLRKIKIKEVKGNDKKDI